MNRIHLPASWHLPDGAATPEPIYVDRRRFLRGSLAATGASLIALGTTPAWAREGKPDGKYTRPFTKSGKYRDAGRPISKEIHATRFNNFYEFTTNKTEVWKLVDNFQIKPWQIEIGGLAKKSGKYDLDDLLKKLPQEERVYRFRCVETWAMTVPWIGVPFRKLVEWAEPSSKAKYVRFETAWRPDEMPDMSGWGKNFPYFEALRIDEATNDLTMLTTGMYGKVLPKQNGAPCRIITPWKYGYKSPKSIVRIEFVEKRPDTFWNLLQPRKYGFYSNVNPNVPHPRWSQAKEWRIPSEDKRYDTQMFNGYGEQVAAMYKGMDLVKNH
ncbi:MAG: protein-methionine-sulfoxide reductase catalytic subunit MsrP [Planctomycetota bacterium]